MPGSTRGARVLIVAEDQVGAGEVTLLERFAGAVERAGGPRAALARLATGHFDVVIGVVDRLPKGAGLRLVADVAAQAPGVHVLLLRGEWLRRAELSGLHEVTPRDESAVTRPARGRPVSSRERVVRRVGLVA